MKALSAQAGGKTGQDKRLNATPRRANAEG